MLPGNGEPIERARSVARTMQQRKAGARAVRTSAILGITFRIAARLRLVQWYMNHQRRIHTLVSDVRGPDEPQRIGGHTVTEVVPMSVGGGNVTLTFVALSYAGTLALSVVFDPDWMRDCDVLIAALNAEFAAIMSG